MKANDGSGNNPDRDEWETPLRLFNDLAEQYEEAILDEFGELTIVFQKKHGFENSSMIRLLEDIIKLIQQES